MSDDRGSILPLMIGFFLVAGILLTGGVAASAAFIAQRDLQSGCDGAAIASAQGFIRSDAVAGGLAFDPVAAQTAVAQYKVQEWGSAAPSVIVTPRVDGNRVIVTCSRTVHIVFESLFSPGGLRRTANSTADAPAIG